MSGSPLPAVLGELVEVPLPLQIDVEAETRARETGPATAIRLTDLRFRITRTATPPGDSDDFAFVDWARIYVESTQTSSTLTRALVADAMNAGAPRTDLVFTPNLEVNLLPYVNEGAVLTAEASATIPPDDVTFDGTATLSIEVF